MSACNSSSSITFLLHSMLVLGQYDCGTTDTTRTMHLGTPSDHQKFCFTLVLKGHIHLSSVVFPEKTAGCQLDALARTCLWKEGLDYNHGTGHGVGAALNVHEVSRPTQITATQNKLTIKYIFCYRVVSCLTSYPISRVRNFPFMIFHYHDLITTQ